MGVRPAACTSLSRGSEILPSGRTGAVRLTASLLHTETCSTSSGPMRYPGRSAAVRVHARRRRVRGGQTQPTGQQAMRAPNRSVPIIMGPVRPCDAA